MCSLCTFYEKLVPASKADVALDHVGFRTIHGFYDDADAAVLGSVFTHVDIDIIRRIASLMNAPRLLEVAGIALSVNQYRAGAFSRIKDVSIPVVNIPFSILYWSHRHEAVVRIKTIETEFLHGALEKVALRRASIDAINTLLHERYGLHFTMFCSCSINILKSEHVDAWNASAYLKSRERFGRLFDSDVLTHSGHVFTGVSLREVPSEILLASADFGATEVAAFELFMKAVRLCHAHNRVRPDMGSMLEEARAFFLGEVQLRKAA